MSDFFHEYEAQHEKFEALMAENSLIHTFTTNSFPITMTVQPNNAPESQMALFERSDDGVSSQDAKLVLQFYVGEIIVRVYGRFIISDTLMGKIKSQAKKMCDLWLQADFASRMVQAGYSNTAAHRDPSSDVDSTPESANFDGFFEDDDGDEEDSQE